MLRLTILDDNSWPQSTTSTEQKLDHKDGSASSESIPENNSHRNSFRFSLPLRVNGYHLQRCDMPVAVY
ncbi:Hypothetical predicted protein [Octopus vulgaris]|uniref:Uncharacterized protein n=1 Tax=Octopus vulgaris TaxID=6645 RepID=A0AA36FF66_OCTVU|nr:Hypothetical predicted protein [Octopus vulgaris]